MRIAAILGTVMLSLQFCVARLPLAALSTFRQSAQTPQTPEASTTSNSGTPPATTASKPCPAGAPKTPNPDCKAASSKTRHKKAPQTPASATPADGPTKTVVRNGGTSDMSVAISPGLSQQQMSKQAQNTDQLLASTNANLKVIAERQLTASQQDTVNQIKNFMEQARAASSEGDVQRAYNLANKANMLSADLKGK